VTQIAVLTPAVSWSFVGFGRAYTSSSILRSLREGAVVLYLNIKMVSVQVIY
jgi:hypothetical protein